MILQNEQLLAETLAELGRAMQLAGAALEKLAQGRAPDQGSTDAPKASIEMPRWPRIGGHDFINPPPGAFLAPAYLARYKPGKPRLIYVGACDGLKRLSNKLGIPHNKVSTSAPYRLSKRLKELDRIRYGSLYLNQGAFIEEDGFAKWKTYNPPRHTTVSENSPVSVDGAALRLVMPNTMDERAFDNRFDELVSAGSVAPWLESSDGLAHIERVGALSSYACRFTSRIRDGRGSTEAARELVAFRSSGDFDRLVSIIERVVLEHLDLWPASATH